MKRLSRISRREESICEPPNGPDKTAVQTVSAYYLSRGMRFQQCGILTCVDSDKPVQPPFKLRNTKCCSVSSLTIIGHSSD